MPNSLWPKLAAVASDRTFQGWAIVAGKWLLASCVLPGCYAVVIWTTTRYGTSDAKRLTARVGVLEQSVGPREKALTCADRAPELRDDTALEIRVRVLEQWKLCREERLLEQLTAVHRRLVSLAAATAETRPALRAQTAQAAVLRFDTVMARQKVKDPEEAAGAALETRPPR